jgi:two-component system chemotaxis response regulator CheY
MTTLIVEDDFTSRLLLQMFLSKYGDCHIAVNGKEAVEAYRMALRRKQPYNLICMDILMPLMDGHEAATTIRDYEDVQRIPASARVKVFMISSLNDEDSIVRSAREACDAYLVKPIDIGVLLSKLRAFGLVPGQ